MKPNNINIIFVAKRINIILRWMIDTNVRD